MWNISGAALLGLTMGIVSTNTSHSGTTVGLLSVLVGTGGLAAFEGAGNVAGMLLTFSLSTFLIGAIVGIRFNIKMNRLIYSYYRKQKFGQNQRSRLKHEGGTAEGGTAEGDTAEGDTAEGDTAEGDTAEGEVGSLSQGVLDIVIDENSLEESRILKFFGIKREEDLDAFMRPPTEELQSPRIPPNIFEPFASDYLPNDESLEIPNEDEYSLSSTEIHDRYPNTVVNIFNNGHEDDNSEEADP